MKKKVISALLIGTMALSLAACGSSSDSSSAGDTTSAGAETTSGSESSSASTTLDGTWPEETVKIGFLGYDATNEQQMATQEYFDYLAEYFNIEMIYSEDLSTVEDCNNFIQDCASAGCKAVIGYYNQGEEAEAELASSLGMYYWGQLGGSDEAYEAVKDDPYYLGGYTHAEGGEDGNYSSGYTMATSLCEAGCEKIIVATGGAEMGTEMFINRLQGFEDAIADYNEENGTDVQIVSEDAGYPGTDGAFEASQASSLDGDYDAIASLYNIAVYFQPLLEKDKADGSVKLATLGTIDESYQSFMESGAICSIIYEEEEATFGNAIPMILNAVEGNKVTNEDGSALRMNVQYWNVQDIDTFNNIYELHSNGEYYVTADDIANLTYHYNEDLTSEDFISYFESMDVSMAQ